MKKSVLLLVASVGLVTATWAFARAQAPASAAPAATGNGKPQPWADAALEWADRNRRGMWAWYVEYHVFAWAWTPLGAAVGVGCGYLGVLGLARAERLGRVLNSRVRYRCPHCPGEEVAVRCPGCGAVHPDHRPDRYGIWTKRCGACKAPFGTTGWSGFHDAPKACGRCRRDLGHPLLGRVPEYHVAVVGAAGAGKTAWMSAAVSTSVPSRSKTTAVGRSGTGQAPG